ncbi:MAG: hypothetical protein KDB22_23700 [Planctomycetales bacterium]|nr:hypothetical protein [Planctomycetales bacterium]
MRQLDTRFGELVLNPAKDSARTSKILLRSDGGERLSEGKPVYDLRRGVRATGSETAVSVNFGPSESFESSLQSSAVFG